jgi:hypothetical protein
MKQHEIKKLISDLGYEDVLLFENPSYDTAFVGISEDFKAVYDYDLMVEHLMSEDGMEMDEAIDFIEYNTIRSLPYYDNHPIIFTKIENLQ